MHVARADGAQVKQFLSYCTGLPAPECADNPLGYKFSWSPRGVLLAALNNAAFLEDGKQVDVAGTELMSVAAPYYVTPAYAFVAYPNRNSVPFREFYGIPEADKCVRGTLRYQVFPEFIRSLVRTGWMDVEPKEWLAPELSWAEVTQRTTGAADASETYALPSRPSAPR
jgi:saccharopine dehydrogenase-like NADP-dependent oxidoreductase